MDFVRIGSKIVDRQRIKRRIDEILSYRAEGRSQQETADLLELDRPFVSRIEALGEVHRGHRIALIGFPVENKEEIERIAHEEGIGFILLYSEVERLAYVSETPGSDLVNDMMQAVTDLKSFDAVIFLGSDKRIGLVEAMIGRDRVYGIEIGKSPITSDVWVDPKGVVQLIRGITA